MRSLLLALLILLSTSGLGFGPPAVVDSSAGHGVPLHASSVAAVQALQPPAIGAEAWAIVDGDTGALLAGHNAHERLAPASTTKIATALVAIEHGDLDEMVEVDVDSRLMYDSSVMGLVPGERLSLRDLLYGLLLPSGNDAAIAIARHIAGSEAAFAELMNEKVRRLGLENTHFVNPHGLDAPGHYSSAYDLALLAREAMRLPVFATIVATREASVGGHELITTNHLLYRYEGLDGVKTGYTENAGQALVASATRGGKRFFTTVLRSTDRIGDTIPLLDYAFANFATRELVLDDSPVNIADNETGTGLRMAPTAPVTLPRWQIPFIRLALWIDPEARMEEGGARLGSIAFYLGDRLLAEAPIYAR